MRGIRQSISVLPEQNGAFPVGSSASHCVDVFLLPLRRARTYANTWRQSRRKVTYWMSSCHALDKSRDRIAILLIVFPGLALR